MNGGFRVKNQNIKKDTRSLAHYAAYYLSIAIPILVSFALLTLIPSSDADNSVLSASKLFWFTGVVFVATNAIGVLYGSPWHAEQMAERRYKKWSGGVLIVSYVSRGDNDKALRRAITASRKNLIEMGVRHKIEVVTDVPVETNADVSVVVPAGYATENKAKYKARALHYAASIRHASNASWVVHLDEESVITKEAIIGVNDFVGRSSDVFRIGQGEIKYNAHNYGSNALITSIDSIRTGDDLGRFRLQYKMFRRPLFGMHGSFFVVNSLLEKQVGFDLGGKGSITEDAYFALTCADLGVQFEWVNGFIREQSPFTLLALLKQRRRWITGLRLLVWDKSISLRQRLMLGANMLLWRLAWVGPVVTAWNFLAGGSRVPYQLCFASALLTGMVGAVYMLGAYRNVIGVGLTFMRQFKIWALSGLLAPISCAIEGIAVIYSIVRPIKTFDVVNKN